MEIKPGQVVQTYFAYAELPDAVIASTIRLTCKTPSGNKTGVIKLKKWGNGAQGDKNARWRRGPSPWWRMLHDAWKSRGGHKIGT